MACNPRPLLYRPYLMMVHSRSFHYKFKRANVPPLQEPKESPFIVGPYLKPDYVPRQYITEEIKQRDDNDLNHFIYEPTKIEPDEDRKVRLLLIADVEGLGVAGQVVDAPYRLGASRLIAMKKAEYATDFAHNWYKFGPKTIQSASSALSPRTARLLQSRIFKLPISKNIIVQPWHLSLALRFAGCLCPVEAIESDSITDYVDEHDDTIVKCTIKINNHERVEVKFKHETTERPEDL